jgi:uncharacterized repeat protein (TIGR03837 family)
MLNGVDIFCTVIDNFGDIGVCWRLAQQLQDEYGLNVRLWVDDLNSFAKLEPTLNPQLAQQTCQKIEICYWSKSDFDTSIEPYDVVIEGFGCRLPDSFLQAMAQQTPPPVWLNLEYLSAESWTLDCHGLGSAHPNLPLKQYFFFPSFDPRGGGLLREQNLLQQRDDFLQNPQAQADFWHSLNCTQALSADYRLSLFAYENQAVAALLTALSQQQQTSFIAIPEGRVLANINTWANTTLKVGDKLTVGAVTVAVLPFLSPIQYDQLLWACDINMVRGEDSFIRAHWAEKPLLWHIYPQEEQAHLDKLEAWLSVSANFISPEWQNLQRAWVSESTNVALWATLLTQFSQAKPQHTLFSEFLGQQETLCHKLMAFCAKKHDAI